MCSQTVLRGKSDNAAWRVGDAIKTQTDTETCFFCQTQTQTKLKLYKGPGWTATLLDRKGHGITQAEGRVISAGLDDVVSLFEGDAGTYNSPFNLGVSLHSCGALSDVAQKVCLAAAAAYILCPCCYGQLAASGVQPRSEATASVPATSWDLIASTAEFSIQPQKQRGRHSKPSPGGQWDFGDTEDYLLASDDSSPIHFVFYGSTRGH